ncbi:hypothetical protein HDU81_010818 [Chytriomyces hyalinus]|nr:hypothetical protein HDU81_010818 [Chytriomyces hyalinus]
MPRHPPQRIRPNPIQTHPQQQQQQQLQLQQQQRRPSPLRGGGPAPRGDAEIPGDLDLFFLELEAMFNARADGERSQPLHQRAVAAMREELRAPPAVVVTGNRRRERKAGSVTSEESAGVRESVSPVKRDQWIIGSVNERVPTSAGSSSERMRQNAPLDVCLHVPAVDGVDGVVSAADIHSQSRALTMSDADCMPLTWDDVFGGSNTALVDMFGHWDAGLDDSGSEAFVTPVVRWDPETTGETPAVPAEDIV